MIRTYHHAESVEETTNNNTGYTTKVSLPFTPGDNETWLIIATWMSLCNNSGGSAHTDVKLVRTSGTPLDFNEQQFSPKDTTDYITGCCFGVETFGTSPGEQTYGIQYRLNSGLYSQSIKEAKLTAIRLESNDEYNSDASRSTYNTDTNWQDKLALTFTPGSSGDYLILASCDMDISSYTYSWKARLDVDGITQYDTTDRLRGTGGVITSWGVIKKLTLNNSEHTIKIQYATENTSLTVGIAHSFLIALRLDDFPGNYYAESENRDTTNEISYQDKVTLTQSLSADDYLILASCGGDGGAISESAYRQLIQDGTSLGESLVEPNSTANRHHPYVNSKFLSASSQEYIWKIQHKAETVNWASGIQEARIAVLKLTSSMVKGKIKLDKKSMKGYKDKDVNLTFSAIPLKISGKVNVGVISTVGASYKSVKTSVSSILQSLADLATQKLTGLIQQALEAGMSFVGDSIRKPGKILSGALTSVGSLLNNISTALIRTFTSLADLISEKTGPLEKVLSAGMNFVGTTAKKITHSFSAQLAFVGENFKKFIYSLLALIGWKKKP